MKLKTLLLVVVSLYILCAQTHIVVSQTCEPATPALHVDTTYPTPTGPNLCVGTVTGITCNLSYSATVSGLQAALDEASLSTHDTEGATVVINSTTTFSGTITLPNRTANSEWIIIRTSNMAGIPAAETRVVPSSHAAAMPKISVTDSRAVITAVGTSSNYPNHYRLVGLEIKLADSFTGTHYSDLVRLGAGTETSTDVLPSDIVIDRCFIHGNSVAGLERGVDLNSKSSAVIDSYISECHLVGAESQAILSYNTPGPIKIVNNYLEAAGENLFFGGAPSISNLVPSDIEVRRNYLYKQPSWRTSANWNVKNLLEFKSGQRALIDGNVLEYNWVGQSDQDGTAVRLKSTNEGGNAPYNVTRDVTFTNNIVRHASKGVNITGRDGSVTSQTQKIKIANNLFADVSGANWGGAGTFLVVTEASCITLDHNTAFHDGKVIETYGATTSNFVYTNNLTSDDTGQGVKGDGQAQGSATLGYYMPGYVFLKNVIAEVDSTLYPPNNYYPATIDDAKFVDRAHGNYRLAADSPYKNAGTDGTDIGIDQDALDCAINGVVSGSPPSCGVQDVVWTNLVGVTANGNDLTKTGAAGWNAGANSVQSITWGDGYVEFSTAELNTGKMCGLSNGSAGAGYAEIDYAIHLRATDNKVGVYENGMSMGVFSAYVPGERFRVAVEGGVVKYYRNYAPGATPFYTSTVAPTYPLLVDTSLNTVGATITDAVIASTSTITWTNLVGVVVNASNGLTKTGAAGWNAGANSTQTLSGDGYVEFSTAENDTGKMCGLSHSSAGQSYTEIDYAISLGAANQVRVYENGVLRGSFGTYAPGERYRVAVEGGVVKYYKNYAPGATPFYTSTVSPTYSLLVDTSLYTTGATITDVVISGAWN